MDLGTHALLRPARRRPPSADARRQSRRRARGGAADVPPAQSRRLVPRVSRGGRGVRPRAPPTTAGSTNLPSASGSAAPPRCSGPRPCAGSEASLPQFFAYNEDTDWCLRARLAGLRILYDPDASVRHRLSATSQGPSSPMVRLLAQRNALLCLVRNAPLGVARHFLWLALHEDPAARAPARRRWPSSRGRWRRAPGCAGTGRRHRAPCGTGGPERTGRGTTSPVDAAGR